MSSGGCECLYRVGDAVLAPWSDKKKYAGRVRSVLPNGKYEVLFFDCFVKGIKGTRLKKGDEDDIISLEELEAERKIGLALLQARSSISQVPVNDFSAGVRTRSNLPRREPLKKQQKKKSIPAYPVPSVLESSRGEENVESHKPIHDTSHTIGIDSTADLNLSLFLNESTLTVGYKRFQKEDGASRGKSVIVQDGRLPYGWTKHKIQKKGSSYRGHSWEVFFVNSSGRRFYTYEELHNYHLSNYKKFNKNWFHFSLNQAVEESAISNTGKRSSCDIYSDEESEDPINVWLLAKDTPSWKQHKHWDVEMSGPSWMSTEDNTVSSVGANSDDNDLLIQIRKSARVCPNKECRKKFRNSDLLKEHIRERHLEYVKCKPYLTNIADAEFVRGQIPPCTIPSSIPKVCSAKGKQTDREMEDRKLDGNFNIEFRESSPMENVTTQVKKVETSALSCNQEHSLLSDPAILQLHQGMRHIITNPAVLVEIPVHPEKLIEMSRYKLKPEDQHWDSTTVGILQKRTSSTCSEAQAKIYQSINFVPKRSKRIVRQKIQSDFIEEPLYKRRKSGIKEQQKTQRKNSVNEILKATADINALNQQFVRQEADQEKRMMQEFLHDHTLYINDQDIGQEEQTSATYIPQDNSEQKGSSLESTNNASAQVVSTPNGHQDRMEQQSYLQLTKPEDVLQGSVNTGGLSSEMDSPLTSQSGHTASSSSSQKWQEEDLINCVCDSTAEFGAMVQCYKCRCWQHIDCINEEASICKKFLCSACGRAQKFSYKPSIQKKHVHQNGFGHSFRQHSPDEPLSSGNIVWQKKVCSEFEELLHCGLQAKMTIRTLKQKINFLKKTEYTKLYNWSMKWTGISSSSQKPKALRQHMEDFLKEISDGPEGKDPEQQFKGVTGPADTQSEVPIEYVRNLRCTLLNHLEHQETKLYSIITDLQEVGNVNVNRSLHHYEDVIKLLRHNLTEVVHMPIL